MREQSSFALKGGTAINFFIADLPCLSVDIDLAFIHNYPRNESIHEMQECLTEFSNWIGKKYSNVIIDKKMSSDASHIVRLFIRQNQSMIKIEPSYVMRGILFPVEYKDLNPRIRSEFGVFIDQIPIVSEADLYAGKICAALNRQHPRDLFDIKWLLENRGINQQLMDAFIVYLACDQRPIHELLDPNFKDIRITFEREFAQMTKIVVTLNELYTARDDLLAILKKQMTSQHKKFLCSIKAGNPDYQLLPFDGLDMLPALRWKQMNIARMEINKQLQMLNKLEQVLTKYY